MIDRKKIVMIGPVLPYRGGIAQHTTMLKREMAKIGDVLTISFCRQYPSWLFPGESDKDPDYAGHQEEQTEYMIDSLNPLTWYKTVKRVTEYQAKTVIIPWWTVFWAPCIGYIARALSRKGIEIIFFCHNVVEHEAAAWKTFLTRMVLKNASRFVVHTKEDEANLRALFPKANITVHPHPIYDQFPEPKGELQRRGSLEILFYGFVRPYKGLDDLIDAMALLKDRDIKLTIAGEFWGGEQETRAKIEGLELANQIELRPRYHSDAETAELFSRADAVVLPYRSATGSGVVPIAYHYNKPVVVTRVGGLPDVVKDTLTGFIIPEKNVEALASVLHDLDSQTCESMKTQIHEIKKELSWESLALAANG